QQAHLVGALRALADPFLQLDDVQLQALFRTGGAGIEITETRDVAAVARVALVGHHHVVEGTTLGARARKTNLDYFCLLSRSAARQERREGARAWETANCSGFLLEVKSKIRQAAIPGA